MLYYGLPLVLRLIEGLSVELLSQMPCFLGRVLPVVVSAVHVVHKCG